MPFTLDLASEPASYEALEELLSRVVQTTGGRAGVLATWDAEHPEKGPHVQSVALPVTLEDRSAGLLCLLQPQDARLLQRLLVERRWLEAVVHHSASGILILDPQGLVVGFNVALERLSGRSLDAAVGHPSHEMFPLRLAEGGSSVRDLAEADEPPQYDRAGQAPLSSGRRAEPDLPPQYDRAGQAPLSSGRRAEPDLPERVREAQLQVCDGSWVDVEASASGLRDERGGILGFVLTLRDIRARKERERLERIFLSGVSHELHTPIAVIQGFSGILADPEIALDAEQVREKAAIIQEESRRLERMVEQMLYATRIQCGGIRLELEPVAVDDLARRVLHKLEPLATAAASSLRITAPPSMEPIEADPQRVEQVLSNLVENALKYARGQDVEVVVRDHLRWIEVAVADRGPGIAEEVRERIFEPFERGGQGTGTRIRGAGLGLYICKSIVEAHGGRIGVDTDEGRGARFWFRLPRPAHPLEARP